MMNEINWKQLGTEYANDYDDSEDAFESAKSDSAIWSAWKRMDTDEQESAADDFGMAFAARCEEIKRAGVIEELKEIVTPSEVASEFGIKEDTVRDACQNGWIVARKSGSTWLMRRADAEKRWNKK